MHEVFNRVEKKYLIKKETYNTLLFKLENKIKPDKYGLSTICNIYYDTTNNDLIRVSRDKPIYKEKFRIRSYGIPNINDNVYLEIKKKYKKIVNKRRISLPLNMAYEFLDEKLDINNTQVEKEINYFVKYYKIKPTLYLAYDRIAYTSDIDSSLRITFDTNIRSRDYDLRLELGDYGDKLYDNEYYLMEIKCNNAFPLFLTKVLTELNIYPTSFSKYGKIYEKKIKENLCLKVY